MRGRRQLTGTIVVSAMLAGLVAALLPVGLQSRRANPFGFALPGPQGLPFRVHYAGRNYSNHFTCAHASWCHTNGPPPCTTEQTLRGYGYWPLQRVGTLPTLGSAAHPILRYAPPAGWTTMALYVQKDHNCYIPYALEGGP